MFFTFYYILSSLLDLNSFIYSAYTSKSLTFSI